MTRTHEIKLDGYGAHTTLADDRPVMLLGTAESYGIEMLHIVPGKDWAELTITATFNAADGTSTDMLMGTDGNIAVPTEATAKSGSGRIVFTGVSNGIQRISCDLDYFVVAHSGINGTQSGGIAPSWFEQAARRFMPLGGTTGQVLTKLSDADFEAKWQDSKGGEGGITPTIGDNGNWFLGDTDTGKPSRGDNGKSAYSYAQDGGYTGTEAEFAAKLAAEKLPNPYPLTFTGAVNATYDGSSAKTIEIPSGGGASGLCIYDNYDVALISFAQIDQVTLPIDAGIVITEDDNGNPFSYDGVVVWTDIKSSISYTDIDFNNVSNVHYPIQHGVKDSMNMYVVDGTSMRAIVGSKSCVYIRQTRDDVNKAFYPAPNIVQLPEKITAIHLCPRNKVTTGTFYKIWGLTKK